MHAHVHAVICKALFTVHQSSRYLSAHVVDKLPFYFRSVLEARLELMSWQNFFHIVLTCPGRIGSRVELWVCEASCGCHLSRQAQLAQEVCVRSHLFPCWTWPLWVWWYSSMKEIKNNTWNIILNSAWFNLINIFVGRPNQKADDVFNQNDNIFTT